MSTLRQQLLFEHSLLDLVGTVVQVISPWSIRTGVLASLGRQSDEIRWVVVAEDTSGKNIGVDRIHFSAVHVDSISLPLKGEGDSIPKIVVRFA